MELEGGLRSKGFPLHPIHIGPLLISRYEKSTPVISYGMRFLTRGMLIAKPLHASSISGPCCLRRTVLMVVHEVGFMVNLLYH